MKTIKNQNKTSKGLVKVQTCILLALALLLQVSCRDESGTGSGGVAGEIRFGLKLPGDVPRTGTYAMNGDQELELQTAAVLAFVRDGGDYKFSYIRTGKISRDGVQVGITISANYGAGQRFLILANCNSEIASPTGVIHTGDNIASVMEKLIATQALEWPAGNTSDGARPLRYIPMAALTGELNIDGATIGIGTFSLIRMLARIDVSLKETVTNFHLVSASVFNRKDKGYIAYKGTDPGYWDNAGNKALKAWVPASAGTTKKPSQPAYYKADVSGAIKASIYTFEAASVDVDKKDATTIVVGGYYGYPVNQTVISYYRIDIPQYDALDVPKEGTIGDILRNHLYDIQISGVTCKGESDEQKAFEGAVTLTAGIKDWNLAGIDMAIPGQGDLTIDRVSLRYDMNAISKKTLKVTASQNWTTASADSWITFLNTSGSAGTNVSLYFRLAANATGSNRTGYINVTAGNLTKQIKIIQYNQAALVFSPGSDIFGTGTAFNVENPYLGAVKQLTVTAQAPWTATKTSDAASLIKLVHTPASGITAFPGDEAFKFAMAGNYGNTAKITFNPVTDEFDPVIINITSEALPPAHNGWAGSNIYWDGTKLTFDDVGDPTHQYYQGVYFQWGSLWGISPVGDWSNNSTPVYKPNGSGYIVDKAASWTAIARVGDTNITSNPPPGKDKRDRAYLYEITDGSTGVGDICKYLTEKGLAPGSPAKKWRMPTSNEFETTASYSKTTTWGGIMTSDQADGSYIINDSRGYTKTGIGTPFFPSSGYRDSNGTLGNVGSDGYYWSGSPGGAHSYELSFYSSGVYPATNYIRSFAYSVRCVQE
ncbi:MAG: hypothetical protein LBJ39_06675 [Tannerellaceae bacterium]|jgi:hypothetical protein|nr:hypothetical protein [Tannerellaceae bacterium]